MTECHDTPDNLHASAGDRGAVEIACMLGDSIVDVAHIESGAREPSRRTTLMVMVTGAILLLASGWSFARGVAVARENARAFHHHTEVAGLPANEFRPATLPRAYDAVAFGGLGLGIAALGLGLWRLRAPRRRERFVVGREAGADFAAEVTGGSVTLARARGAVAVVGVAPGMEAAVVTPTGTRSLAELIAGGRARAHGAGHELWLERGESARLSLRQARFLVRPTAPPARSAGLGALALDSRTAAFVGGSALAHLLLVLMLGTIPPDSKSLALDVGSSGSRMAYVQSKAAEEQPIESTGDVGDTDDPNAGGRAAAGEVGKAGTHDATADRGKTQVEGNSQRVQLSRAQAISRARREGMLTGIEAANFRQMFAGTGEFAQGNADVTTWGTGGGDGNAAGEFGRSANGFGPGAGGWPDGTIGTGDDPYSRFTGGADIGQPTLREHHNGPIIDIPRAKLITGGYDKDTIRRYIRRKLPLIKYHYERALLVHPDLQGTVTVTFVIGSNGAVIEAHASGLGDRELLGHVEEVFRSIAFPKPSGSIGVVRVVYPIHLHANG